MPRTIARLALILVSILAVPACTAQQTTPEPYVLPDSTLATWGYAPIEHGEGLRLVTVPTLGRELALGVTLYVNTARDADRYPYTVVLSDLYTNEEPATDHAAFVAEYVSREIGLDPTRAAFVYRLSIHRREGLDLFLRATFRRGTSGNLLSPSWRVLSLEEASAYTSGHDWAPAMKKGLWIEASQCPGYSE